MTPDTIAVAAAERVIKDAVPALIKHISNRTRLAADNIRLQLGFAFQDHMAKTYRRISQLKTLVSKDQPVDLSSIYVSLNLKSESNTVSDMDVVSDVRKFHRLYISGTGGSGKSMLLRWMALQLFQAPIARIPLFIELRQIEFHSSEYFEDTIFKKIVDEGNKESKYIYLKAIEEGLVVVILDGLDEIPIKSKDGALDKISSFSSRNPKCPIIISSRPGVVAQNLAEFHVYHVLPLVKEQAIEVISRTNADDDLKNDFIEKLKTGLFDKHETFLGVPLLVVMMLLTYSSYSEIPEKMSVFYEQAYNTLYSLHDTVSKGPYKRQHFGGLSPDQFSKIFETFCYLTFSKESYDFFFHEIIDFIEQSRALCAIEAKPADILKDMEESVCLIREEGLKHIFSHRSFQEYFASKFCLKYSGPNKYNIIDKCLGDGWEHDTIKLMQEIDYIRFREHWILPSIRKLEQKLKGDRKKPILFRMGEFFDGWRLEAPEDQNAGEFRVISEMSESYYVSSKRSAIRLSQLLSRCTSLPDFYEAFTSSFLIPEDGAAWSELSASLSKVPHDLSSLIELITGASGPEIVSINFKSQNSEWFEAVGMASKIDDFQRVVSLEREQIERDVKSQQDLEISLL